MLIDFIEHLMARDLAQQHYLQFGDAVGRRALVSESQELHPFQRQFADPITK
jgi:hypothetical protein